MTTIQFSIFSALFFWINICTAQMLPLERQVDWSSAGLKDTTTANFTVIDLEDFGIVNDGIAVNDDALRSALSSIDNAEGLIIKFPAGDFLFNDPIVLMSNIVLTGEGADNTRLIFDLGGSSHAINAAGSIENSTQTSVVSTAPKDQNFLEVSNSNLFQIGDWIRINQIDAMLVTDAWAEGTVGQIAQIENIAGGTLHLSSPLRRNYLLENSPTVTKILAIENVGISCLKIERLDDTAPFQSSNIIFNNAVNSWVSSIESINCTFSHIQARFSSNLKIEKSYMHDAFDFGGGGRAYGIMIHLMSNEILVENNIFSQLRHAMILQAGANGNVLTYNYSFDPFWTSFPSDAAGDIVLHGNYIYANLFEQNIVQNMVIDNSHGPNGPNNTFFRNRGESFGIFFSADNSPGQNFIANEVTNQSPPYSLVNYLIQGDDHFIVSNNNKGTIDPPGSNTVSISSFYYSGKPAFVPNSQWAAIGSPNPFNQGMIPALDRIQSGDPFLNTCGEVITSTNESIITDEHVSLYPNPSMKQLYIESEIPITKIALYDLSGRIVQEQFFNTQSVELDIEKFNNGIYVCKIYRSSGAPILKKVVKLLN